MKQTIVRYVISSLITWASTFVGTILILLETMPIEEIPLTGAFWVGILVTGLRILIKVLVEGLPALIEEVKKHRK